MRNLDILPKLKPMRFWNQAGIGASALTSPNPREDAPSLKMLFAAYTKYSIFHTQNLTKAKANIPISQG